MLAPNDTKTPQLAPVYGGKYQPSLDVAEIARRLRKDLKEATLPTALKCAVRIRRFAGGQSLNVAITAAPSFIVWTTLPNGERVYTALARRWRDQIEVMRQAYNFDKSDSQSDYYNTNYYGNTYYEIA